MVASRLFVDRLAAERLLPQVSRVRVELFGSLGATGKGHGSDKAVLLGLEGDTPKDVDLSAIDARLEQIRSESRLSLLGLHSIRFCEKQDIVLHKRKSLPFHPNAMLLQAFAENGDVLHQGTFYSVGGGFVVDDSVGADSPIKEDQTALCFPFTTAAELLALCEQHNLNICEVMLANEQCWRSATEIRSELLNIWRVMQACVENGCRNEGILPGGLKVRRRAAKLYSELSGNAEAGLTDPLITMDWISLYALAVNEENAAGGRIVTAPTNGAAGIIPAVLHYYSRFVPTACDDGIVNFLLTAGAIGILYKENASISGAEVGCQGEVGSACSMAAGALAAVLGGTPAQVENAAEIGMEHNLGLTCDPVGGLVQVPCIERNAMASVKAVNAARMALRGDGTHFVSLDKVIKTMRDTGADMKTKYKETARGGLAINVLEVPVNFPEC